MDDIFATALAREQARVAKDIVAHLQRFSDSLSSETIRKVVDLPGVRSLFASISDITDAIPMSNYLSGTPIGQEVSVFATIPNGGASLVSGGNGTEVASTTVANASVKLRSARFATMTSLGMDDLRALSVSGSGQGSILQAQAQVLARKFKEIIIDGLPSMGIGGIKSPLGFSSSTMTGNINSSSTYDSILGVLTDICEDRRAQCGESPTFMLVSPAIASWLRHKTNTGGMTLLNANRTVDLLGKQVRIYPISCYADAAGVGKGRIFAGYDEPGTPLLSIEMPENIRYAGTDSSTIGARIYSTFATGGVISVNHTVSFGGIYNEP